MTGPTDEQATPRMSWLALLHEQAQQVPELPDLPWRVKDGVAVADLEQLGRMYRVGTTLHVLPPPEPLPLINRLRAVGWHRRTYPAVVPGWIIGAELSRDGAMLRVWGSTLSLPDGTSFEDAAPHSTMDYFSPPPPPPGSSKRAKVLSEDWHNRLGTDDWEGWTATPFIEGTQ